MRLMLAILTLVAGTVVIMPAHATTCTTTCYPIGGGYTSCTTTCT